MRFEVVSLWVFSAVETVWKLSPVTLVASWRSGWGTRNELGSRDSVCPMGCGEPFSRNPFVPPATSILRVTLRRACLEGRAACRAQSKRYSRSASFVIRTTSTVHGSAVTSEDDPRVVSWTSQPTLEGRVHSMARSSRRRSFIACNSSKFFRAFLCKSSSSES